MTVWTDSDKAFLVESRLNGVLVPRIAEQLGHPVSSTYAMAAKLCKVQGKMPLTDAVKARITELFLQGWSAVEIAARTDRTASSIRWALGEIGLKRGREVVWTEQDIERLRDVVRDGGKLTDAMVLFPGRLRANVSARLDAVRVEMEGRKTKCASLIDRLDPKLVEAIRENFVDREFDGVSFVEIRRTAKEIARDFAEREVVVRQAGELVGRSFAPRWTDDQQAILVGALARFVSLADVCRFVAPRVGRNAEAVRSRLKALRLTATGRETFDRPKRSVVAKVAVTSEAARTVVAEDGRKVVTGRATGGGRVALTFRRPAARKVEATSRDDLDRMMETFLRKGAVIRRDTDDREEVIVRALRARGYVLLRQDGGFQIDGRTFVEGVEELETFAARRGVEPKVKEARAA